MKKSIRVDAIAFVNQIASLARLLLVIT